MNSSGNVKHPLPDETSISKPLVVACAANDTFAIGLGVTLHSLLVNMNSARAVHIFIIEDAIAQKKQTRIRETVEAVRPDAKVSWLHAADQLPEDLKTSWCIRPAAYLRLLLPELLPEEYEKVIYLDSDLVVEGDLQELWDVDMQGQALLAVQDFIVPFVACEKGLARYRELGLEPNAPYFNSGVLVINLDRWRAEAIHERVFSYLREHHEDVNLHDQDGLNATLAGRWQKIDPRWNQQTDIFYFKWWDGMRKEFQDEIRPVRPRLVGDPFIVHFTGPYKPWHPLSDHPFEKRFFRHLQETPWFTAAEWILWRAVKRLRRPEYRIREVTRPMRNMIRRHLNRAAEL